MRKLFTLLVFYISFIGWSQVTIKLASIPQNTPKEDKIYVTGNFNAWNPEDSNFQLKKNNDGVHEITIAEGMVPLEFKFTRGNWTKIEADKNGSFLSNRKLNFTGNKQSIELNIETWEDISGGKIHTSQSNVTILSDKYDMRQLNTTRKIWIYLPPDYETSNKKYPVIYMQDGQNLFDKSSSYTGEWGIDESLNDLFSKGDYGVIVVGIENGNIERINEYSPWINKTYGGGKGDLYLQFITESLKPFIDRKYRTLTQAKYNVLAGASMGGLISSYGVLKLNKHFGKAIIMSPAYWFALNEYKSFIENDKSVNLADSRIYIVGGQNESETMVLHIDEIHKTLIEKGLKPENSSIKIDLDGIHNEKYWGREFPSAYQWIFKDVDFSKIK